MGGKGSGGANLKPIEQKKRIGNPGGRALPKADVIAFPVQQAPEPHRPLGKVGTELWERVWLAAAAWLKPMADAESVLLLCEASDERTSLRYRVMSDPDAWRERKALRDLEKQIQSALGELGLNPVDRARLGVSEIRENDFAKLHAKIAQRRNQAQA